MATTNSSFLFGFWAEKMSERWRRRGWGEGNFRRVQMGRKAPKTALTAQEKTRTMFEPLRTELHSRGIKLVRHFNSQIRI